jgi:hypothetical protein
VKKNDHLAQKPDDVAEATDAASLAQGVIEDHADIQRKLSVDKTVSEAAIQANHFSVTQVRNLNETMAKKDVEFARERLIFEVCQPQQARKVPDEYMRGIPS